MALPLPLNSLERYVLAEDGPSSPWTFQIATHCRGQLNRGAFFEAVEGSLASHPLLDAVVVRTGVRAMEFQPGAAHRLPIRWSNDVEELHRWQRHRFALDRETGLRISVLQQAEQAAVYFEFHHTCTDGIGAIEFISDVFARYGQLTGPPGAPEPKPLQPLKLRERTVRGCLVESAGSWRRCVSTLTSETAKILGRRAASLQPSRRSVSPSERIPFPGSLSCRLSHEVLQGLRRSAAAHSATLNDLILAVMFRAIRWWNEQQGRPADREWYRLYVPVNLREPRHEGIPASNLASCVMVTRRGGETRDAARFAQHVSAHMSRLVGHRHELAWLGVASAVCRIPGLLTVMTPLAPRSTAIVTNVGELKRRFRTRFAVRDGLCVAGDILIEDLTSAAPLRRGSHASLSLSTYAGGLTLNLALQSDLFSREDCRVLLQWLCVDLTEIARPHLPSTAVIDAPVPFVTAVPPTTMSL